MGRGPTLVFARIVETLCKLIGVTHPSRMTWCLRRWGVTAFRHAKTEEVLQIKPRKADESLRSAVDWLMKMNKLRPGVAAKIQNHPPVRVPPDTPEDSRAPKALPGSVSGPGTSVSCQMAGPLIKRRQGSHISSQPMP